MESMECLLILLFSLTFGLLVFISGRREVHCLAGYQVKVIAVPGCRFFFFVKSRGLFVSISRTKVIVGGAPKHCNPPKVCRHSQSVPFPARFFFSLKLFLKMQVAL